MLSVKADEGMWFLMHIDRLNERDMQKMGLQLTAEEIYSVFGVSKKVIKKAIGDLYKRRLITLEPGKLVLSDNSK